MNTEHHSVANMNMIINLIAHVMWTQAIYIHKIFESNFCSSPSYTIIQEIFDHIKTGSRIVTLESLHIGIGKLAEN